MHSNKLAKCTALMLALTMTATMSASAAENKFSIEMTEEGWRFIAMANDDTVETGAVIRTAADAKSDAVGYLYRGGAVAIVEKGDTWSKVTSGDVTGYIKNEYLTFGDEAKGLAEYYGDYGVEADWDDVNVFASDDAASKVVEKANDGDAFKIINNNGHWIEVQKGADSTAFVSADDVKAVMLVDNAKAIGGESTDYAASYTSGSQTSAAPQTAAAETSTYEETSAPQADTSYYEEPAYTETEAQYVETEAQYVETEAQYVETEAYYEEPQYVETEAQYVETEAQYYDTSTSQGAADAAYQEYLNAQAAADAAAAQGTDVDAINSTAAAAQSAYARFVELQNIADAEAAGISYDGGSCDYTEETEAPAAEETTTYEEYTDETYVEDVSSADEYYVEETEAPAPETESAASSSDLKLLASIIYCEAGNQSYEGMVAVGAVVMNRVNSASFPNTISDVIYQGGQFTPAYSGSLSSALANGVPDTCYAAAQDALGGSDPTGGCLYFNTSHGSGVHIGAHWFY